MNLRNPENALFAGAELNPDTPSIDLHALVVYEATFRVEDFLEEQIRFGADVVKIICGHGSGRLHAEMKKFLENHLAVAEVRDATQATHEIGSVLYVLLK